MLSKMLALTFAPARILSTLNAAGSFLTPLILAFSLWNTSVRFIPRTYTCKEIGPFASLSVPGALSVATSTLAYAEAASQATGMGHLSLPARAGQVAQQHRSRGRKAGSQWDAEAVVDKRAKNANRRPHWDLRLLLPLLPL